MAPRWPLALAISLVGGGAAAQEDPIGDLLGGPSLPAAEAPPASPPAAPEAAQPTVAPSPVATPQIPAAPQPELDEEGQVIPPPAPSESTPTPPPEAAANPLAQPVPPAAVQPTPPVQAAAPPPQPAPSPAPPAYAPPAYTPPQAAAPPAYAAPPVASTPAAPVPYQAVAPAPPPAVTAAPPYSPPPAAPYASPSASYAPPASPYATTPPPPPAYASPALGVASAPPPSTGVQSRARTPVYVDEHGRTPDAAPNYREIDYEQRLRSSYASAQGLQGPMDGGWTLAVDGDDRYFLQLVERSSGLLEGAWRDLRRSGAVNATGFVEGIQRYGGQLTFSFRPDPREEMSTATLNAGADGKWSGELVRGRDRKPITLRRN